MEYLNFIVLLQILFLGYILVVKNNNFLNKILASIIGISGLSFIFNILDMLNILPTWLFGSLFFLLQPVVFLIAPLVFYYIGLMCGKKPRLYNPLFITTGIIFFANYISFLSF